MYLVTSMRACVNACMNADEEDTYKHIEVLWYLGLINLFGCRDSMNQQKYEGRPISNAHSQITRKGEYVFKQTKVGSKGQYFSYKLTYLFFDIVALSFNTFFPK